MQRNLYIGRAKISCCPLDDLWTLPHFREKELAKKYYDKLFKEYCIADLSRYKENKVGDTVAGVGKWDLCHLMISGWFHLRK